MKLSFWVPSILLHKVGRGISKDGKCESNNPPFRCSFGPKTRICMHHGYSSWWKNLTFKTCCVFDACNSLQYYRKHWFDQFSIKNWTCDSGIFRSLSLKNPPVLHWTLQLFASANMWTPLKRTMQAQRASMELAFWPRTPSRPWERALFPWGGVKVANKTINLWKHKTEICNSVSVSWKIHAKSSLGQ